MESHGVSGCLEEPIGFQLWLGNFGEGLTQTWSRLVVLRK